MRCPYCRFPDSRVVDSREQDEGQVIRRRRSCPECGKRFTTVEEATLAVIKRSGVTEPFSRQKVVNGVRRACQGRPVDEDQLAQLAQTVEEAIRATGTAEVPAPEVGLAILGPLRALDEVAYLRFASVYQSFSSIEDFEKAITELRTEHRSAEHTSAEHTSAEHGPAGSGPVESAGTARSAARQSAPQQPHGITKDKGHSGL
jgi:transcriptional repressor NrdR